MMNNNLKCLLSGVVGAGLGFYAARVILERNYTLSVSDAFYDAKGYSGPGYKKRVTVTVGGVIEQQAEYSAEAPETDIPSVESEAKPYDVVELLDVASLHPNPLANPAAHQAMRNYQGLDLKPQAQEEHVREEFMGEFLRKIEGVPEDEEDDGYGESPLSGGKPVYREPFRISEMDFGEGVPGYKSELVIYYQGDNVLVDGQTGEPFGRVAAMEAVGDGTQLQFGVESSDGDICYMRCAQLKTDFEVQRSEGNFSDVPSSGGAG